MRNWPTTPKFGEDPLLGPVPVDWWGTATPDGDAGHWVQAPIGSHYLKRATVSSTPVEYLKVANAAADADWVAVLPTDTVGATGWIDIGLDRLKRVVSNAIVEPILGTITKKIAIPLSSVLLAASDQVQQAPYHNRLVTKGISLHDVREYASGTVGNIAANGGLLASDTTPILKTVNGDTDGLVEAQWAATNVDAIGFDLPLPSDLDETQSILIKFTAWMGGATDTLVVSADSYFDFGDTKVEDDSGSITGTSQAEYTITIAASDVPAGAKVLSVELTPGAHGNDALNISGLRVELLTSSNPYIESTNGDTDGAQRLVWVAANVAPISMQFVVPADYDEASNFTFTAYSAMAGASDTPTLGIQSYWDVGDTAVADTTAALASSVAEKNATIAAADIPAGAKICTIELTPGAHGTDALYVYGLYLTYTVAATPKVDYLNADTDHSWAATWAAGDVTKATFKVLVPVDADTTAVLELHIRAKMGGASDTPTITLDSHFNEGDTTVVDTSSAITGTTWTEYTITVAAADWDADSQTWTGEITPGTHNTDTFVLGYIWGEYTRL